MDSTESQETASAHKKEAHRCPECHRFFGPRDAVCGGCGTANLHFINERAKILGLQAGSCSHYYVNSELGEACVVCSHIRLRGEPPSPRLSTRTNHICSCCGSQIHATDYCTTCGAKVTFFSVRPRYLDHTMFRYMTQHANYLEQQDPHFEFKIYSPVSHRIWLFVLLFIAIEIAMIGPVAVGSFYVSQRRVTEIANKYELTQSNINALAGFYAGGMTPRYSLITDPQKPLYPLLLTECKAQAIALLNGTAGLSWLPGPEDAQLLQNFIRYGDYVSVDYCITTCTC